jgi:hypothetical protein
VDSTLHAGKPGVNVNRCAVPDGMARRFGLRRAAGLVRRAEQVAVAVLTGDRSGGFLASVCLVTISKAQALRVLQGMRAVGTRSVLLADVAGTLAIGATSIIPLTD